MWHIEVRSSVGRSKSALTNFRAKAARMLSGSSGNGRTKMLSDLEQIKDLNINEDIIIGIGEIISNFGNQGALSDNDGILIPKEEINEGVELAKLERRNKQLRTKLDSSNQKECIIDQTKPQEIAKKRDIFSPQYQEIEQS